LLGVKLIPGTYVVRTSFRHEDPELARTFLDFFVSNYLVERDLLLNVDPSPALDGILFEAQNALVDAHSAVSKFRLQHDLFDVEEQRFQLRAQIAAAIAAPTAVVAEINAPGAAVPPVVVVPPVDVEAIKAQLEALERHSVQLQALNIQVEIAQEKLERASDLVAEHGISSELLKARGPVIEILDAPRINNTQVNPTLLTQTLMTGLITAVVMTSLIFLAAWFPKMHAESRFGNSGGSRPRRSSSRPSMGDGQ